MMDLAINLHSVDSLSVLCPRFNNFRTPEYYCMLRNIHYSIRYLPRFIVIETYLLC